MRSAVFFSFGYSATITAVLLLTMSNIRSYQTIKLKEIHDTHLYDIRPFLKDDAVADELKNSISISGILHPPVLLEGPGGKYDVICGRQRLKSVETVLQKPECLCVLLPEGTKPEDLLVILLEDQFCHGELTIIEQSWFINICTKLIPEEKALFSFLNNLPQGRITGGVHFLSPFIELDEKLQKKIHFSIISEKVVKELQRHEEQDQFRITELIEDLQLGVNNQKRLLQFVTEILHREEISLTSLLTRRSIAEIVNHPKMNSPQKATQLLALLHRMCHPMLSSAEDRFNEKIKDLKLPDRCHVTPAQSFEKDETTLSIKFKDFKSLVKAWSDIARSIS